MINWRAYIHHWSEADQVTGFYCIDDTMGVGIDHMPAAGILHIAQAALDGTREVANYGDNYIVDEMEQWIGQGDDGIQDRIDREIPFTQPVGGARGFWTNQFIFDGAEHLAWREPDLPIAVPIPLVMRETLPIEFTHDTKEIIPYAGCRGVV